VRARRGGGGRGGQPPPPRAAEVGAVAPVCIGMKRERAKREERVRRRIWSEKLKLLYIYDSLDSNEKREKRRKS